MLRLVDLMRSDIVHGRYSEGWVPKEPDIMRESGLPRAVVREALTALREEGLIDRVQGFGTFVVETPRIEDLRDAHGVDHLPRTGIWGRVTHTEIVFRGVVPTPSAIATTMKGVGDEVYMVDYLAYGGQEAVAGATNYFRMPARPGVVDEHLGTDFYDFLTRCGYRVASSTFTLGVSFADPRLSRSALMPERTPLLRMEQTLAETDGEVFDVAFIWLRGDRVLLHSVGAAR